MIIQCLTLAATNPAGASWLQSKTRVGLVAELGALGHSIVSGMSKFKERILFMILGGVLTLGIVALVAWAQSRTPIAIARTNQQLVCYQLASTNFFARFGRWPASATELVSNSMGIVFIHPSPPARDGWGRQIVYEPFTTNAGFGRVLSHGRDGRLGGTDADSDIEFRFP